MATGRDQIAWWRGYRAGIRFRNDLPDGLRVPVYLALLDSVQSQDNRGRGIVRVRLADIAKKLGMTVPEVRMAWRILRQLGLLESNDHGPLRQRLLRPKEDMPKSVKRLLDGLGGE